MAVLCIIMRMAQDLIDTCMLLLLVIKMCVHR